MSFMVEKIDREAGHGPRGRVIAKVNGILEPVIIQALYRASQAGAKIDLVCRGICSLRPGVPGVSGGSLSNIVLTLYGKPIHNAVATSAGLGVPITIVGTLGYILAGLHDQALLPPLSLGFVSLIGVAVMAPVSSFTAPYGARLAHILSRRTLEIAFSIFLVLVSLRFVVSLF